MAPPIADAAAEAAAAAAAEEGSAGSPRPVRTSSSSRRTLGERVVSLGHLLGLGSKASSGDGGKLEGSKRSPRIGEPRLSRSSSGSQPMCLICLEPLTSEDFMVCSLNMLEAMSDPAFGIRVWHMSLHVHSTCTALRGMALQLLVLLVHLACLCTCNHCDFAFLHPELRVGQIILQLRLADAFS